MRKKNIVYNMTESCICPSPKEMGQNTRQGYLGGHKSA